MRKEKTKKGRQESKVCRKEGRKDKTKEEGNQESRVYVGRRKATKE